MFHNTAQKLREYKPLLIIQELKGYSKGGAVKFCKAQVIVVDIWTCC